MSLALNRFRIRIKYNKSELVSINLGDEDVTRDGARGRAGAMAPPLLNFFSANPPMLCVVYQ